MVHRRGEGAGGGVHPTGKLSRLLKYDEHVFLTIINRLLRGHVLPKLKGEEGGGGSFANKSRIFTK